MEPALQEALLPKYIAIEGPIGVGKTTLAHKIAETFNYDVFLEQPTENPFLKSFYRNPKQSALATQLFFLFQRMQQIEDLKQRSLFEPVRVADFLIQKDRLFAEVTLSEEEMGLYDKVYEHLTLDAPSPDLVIYLQAPVEVLLDRINKRGNPDEKFLTVDYLERLNDAYSKFFLYFENAPLLIINASDIDLESGGSDYDMLINKIMSDPRGKEFYQSSALYSLKFLSTCMSDKVYDPPKGLTNPHIKNLDQYTSMYKQSIEDPKAFFGKEALTNLSWSEPFTVFIMMSSKNRNGLKEVS